MNHLKKIIFIFSLSLTSAFAQYHIRYPDAIPLHGEWSFALDPAETGISGKWYMDQIPQGNRIDKVTVPHCFSSDPRYQFYMGTVWYRKTFAWKPSAGKRVILHFDAAYYKTHVWLNNQKVGEHEGGYTPFSFDITDLLKDGDNLLAVSVNNDTWKTGTIPGAKDTGEINAPFMGWMNYGGLVRPVYLTIEPEIYAENIKIEAVPDLEKGTAVIRTNVRVRNATSQPASPKISYSILSDGKPVPVKWKTGPGQVPAGQTAFLAAETSLTAAQVKLWNLDDPNLYQLKAIVGQDTISANFGIRKVEVKNAQLLLNAKVMKLGGGNRVVDYPGLGSVEPDWLIEKDFRLMKEAGMEFQRLTHYTPSEYFYDLADRHGMLIITEAGNWQLTPNQMDNDSMRRKFKSQFVEMAERDWNHPSVIAYSVGNEYHSDKPAGQRWTKDMIAFAREVDPTRLYTFASMMLNKLPANPEDEASQYVDFVCTNTYGNHAKSLDHIHKLYPDKPILMSEWGTRADTKDEAFQAQHISDIMAEVRKRPYVAGTSWWTYNDYQSRYHNTAANGYRPWGIVGPDRSLRPAYQIHQKELAVVTIEKTGFTTGDNGTHLLKLKIHVRPDFPSYAVRGYLLKTGNTTITIPNLSPGESKELTVSIAGFDQYAKVGIYKPTGFLVTEELIDLK